MFKANINDIQRALHDDKCGGEEDKDIAQSVAEDLCPNCDEDGCWGNPKCKVFAKALQQARGN